MRRTIADGSPTPLGDYLATHGLTIHAVAKRLRLHENVVQHHARGLSAPSLGIAFLYQEELGIDIRHWRDVPAVAYSKEEHRRDPDTLPKKQRDYMRRRYHDDPEFRARLLENSRRQTARKIQMVKEGKAYYTTSAAGNPMIRIKPEFKKLRKLP